MSRVSRALSDRRAAPGGQPDEIAVGDAEVARHCGMDLDERLGLGRDQLRHAPGLRARLVVQQHPAGGQVERIVVVRLLGRRPVLDGWKRARPSAVAKRSRNSRGVPGWSSAGQGQNTPSSAAMRA